MRTHRFAPASLLFGLLFAGLGLAFLQGDITVWHVDWSWFWPAALVLTGVLVLASLRTDRGTDATAPHHTQADAANSGAEPADADIRDDRPPPDS